MAVGQERLTRANRLAHLESILDVLASADPTVPQDDARWLVDLLAPVATPHTSFRIAPAPQRERTQGALFDALRAEYREISSEVALGEELKKIERLFYFLYHHPEQPLEGENKDTLARVVRLIRRHLLNENSTPRKPSLR